MRWAVQSLVGCLWPLMCPGTGLVGLCFPPLRAFRPVGDAGATPETRPGGQMEMSTGCDGRVKARQSWTQRETREGQGCV